MAYTLSQIKEANTRAGGKFFSRENMRFAGDTMRNLSVSNKGGVVLIKRIRAAKRGVPLSTWEFNPETGRIKFRLTDSDIRANVGA